MRQFCAKFGLKKAIFEKIAIDNQQVTCGGRVLLNPASATTTSEKQITKAFRTFFVYTPVQGSDCKTEIMNQGKTVFAQIMSLIPKNEFYKCVKIIKI